MLSSECTSKILQLPLNKLKILKEESIGNKVTLTLKRRTKFACCPHCSKKTKNRHGNDEYMQKGVKHFTTFKYEILLNLVKRRFFCDKCQKTFLEPFECLPDVKKNGETDREDRETGPETYREE